MTTTKQVPIAHLFNLPAPESITLPVAPATEYTPKINTNYAFRPELVQLLSNWHFRLQTKNLYVSGPTGSGKSTIVEQFSARLGREVFRVACHGRMEFSELVGHVTVRSKPTSMKGKILKALSPFQAMFGSEASRVEAAIDAISQVPGQPEMQFELGPLPLAMIRGATLLLDEFDTLPASVALGLNGIMDGAPLLIADSGRVVQPHPDFRVAMTGNTAGSGDTASGGLYKGTNRQNLATMDRCLAIEVGYMDAETEIALLNKIPGSIPALSSLVVSLANDIRHAFKQGDLQATLSTRGCMAWVDVALSLTGSTFYPDHIKAGLEIVLLNKCSLEDRTAITKVYEKIRGPI